MAEPKILHAWLPNRRSLCDRRSRPPANPDDLTIEERLKDFDEQINAPVCGACIVVLDYLRGDLAMFVAARGQVWPRTFEATAKLLDRTA
jgi:hypothetical protein